MNFLQQKNNSSLSFCDRLKGAISEKKSNEETTLLLDCSGSMAERYDGKSKYSYLQNAIVGMDMRKIYFNSDVSPNNLPPRGGTDLALAIYALPDCKRAILVSDGLPDSEEEAILAAQSKRIPIDIIFIGDDPRGRSFMDRLANLTGGRSSNIQIEEIYQLKSKILMLKGG